MITLPWNNPQVWKPGEHPDSLYQNPFIEVRKNKNKQWGLFARETILDGELLMQAPHIELVPPIDQPMIKKLTWNISLNPQHPNETRLPVFVLGLFSLIGHSEQPNIAIEFNDELNVWEAGTIKTIEANQEILFNY